jgi:hypothetical protein
MIKVVIAKIQPQKPIKPPNVTRPVPWGGKATARRRRSLRAALLSPIKKTKLSVYPKVCPVELHVDAQPTFRLWSIVRAHPSTAMSCVAINRYKTKKITVN